jgi:hypothetical protein
MEAGLKQNKIEARSAASESFKIITESLFDQIAAIRKKLTNFTLYLIYIYIKEKRLTCKNKKRRTQTRRC